MTAIDTTILVAYFLFILGFGAFFGKYATTTKDFFFGGQRFSWWLIAMSCASMVVGSYSFVKYSAVAYEFGFSSTQSYLNDWTLIPLWLFGWFPIIYYSRVQSIPEYMERRFGPVTRIVITVLLLVYMIGYIGINFFTLGIALNGLIPWSIFGWAVIIAVITAVYVTFGGQTSVIMTDLVQGFLLIFAGFFLFFLGIHYLGGFDVFWNALPPDHKTAFSPLTEPPDFAAVGIFWQDGVANTAAFYFLNQGLIMRFLAVRSEADGRRAVFTVVLLLMPLTAFAVSNAGWLGTALVKVGLIQDLQPRDVFIRVTQFLCNPGIFGFIIAALIAALMSTVDALINAVSAIVVNDVWRPYIRPKAPDRHYLKVARYASILASIVGLALVPVYMQFDSIYSAHAAFTAAITPPLVSVILLGFLWKRFTARAAVATMVGGTIAIAFSFFVPDVIIPFAHGVAAGGLHHHAFKFMRALYGLVMSVGIGVAVSLLDRKALARDLRGLTVSPRVDLMRLFKGSEPNLRKGKPVLVTIRPVDEEGVVRMSAEDADRMAADPGDHIYVSDSRWWLGGLKSVHAVMTDADGGKPGMAEVGRDLLKQGLLDPKRPLRISKIL
ncbi:MAG: sodium/solute symporter [Deltaproteobacteria bacterium]|nr:sodium/solute symporter [Deltaproteobacteria bacterium]